jgi:hypothetical protein
LSDVQLAKTFSHSVACLFTLVTVFFTVQKIFLILMQSYLPIPSLCWANRMLFIVIKFAYMFQCIPYFFWSNFTVSDFTLRSLVHFVDISTKWETWIYFQSSTCRYPVFPTQFTEEVIFSPMYVLDSSVKNQMVEASWVYCPLPLVFMPVSL